VRETALDERIVRVAHTFSDSGIAIAFGGALALAYYGEPRATIDIDLNVFVLQHRAAEILDIVRPLGVDVSGERQRKLERDGQVRLPWDRYSLDLFLSTHPFHESCAKRVRLVPFADVEIPILAGEDLVVFKLLFNRTKDWIDIEQVLFVQAGRFDIGYVDHWAMELLGQDDERVARFREALRNASGAV
jgi:hypothetical protein